MKHKGLSLIIGSLAVIILTISIIQGVARVKQSERQLKLADKSLSAVQTQIDESLRSQFDGAERTGLKHKCKEVSQPFTIRKFSCDVTFETSYVTKSPMSNRQFHAVLDPMMARLKAVKNRVFADETEMFEVNPGEHTYFIADSGVPGVAQAIDASDQGFANIEVHVSSDYTSPSHDQAKLTFKGRQRYDYCQSHLQLPCDTFLVK